MRKITAQKKLDDFNCKTHQKESIPKSKTDQKEVTSKSKTSQIGAVSKSKKDKKNTIPESKTRQKRLAVARMKQFLEDIVAPTLTFNLKHNCRYTSYDLLTVITNAALCSDFIQNSSDSLQSWSTSIPDGDTVRRHITRYGLDELERLFTSVADLIFASAKEKGLFDKPVDLAIDWTSVRYYGEECEMVLSTEAERGTTKVFQFATIAIVEKDRRLTLKALPLESRKSDYLQGIVKKLLEYAMTKVDINIVYMDRGFFSGAVISTLQTMNVFYLMPAVRNQKIQKMAEQVKEPTTCRYKMKTRNGRVTFKLVLFKHTQSIKRKGQITKTKAIGAFATNLSDNIKDIQQLYALYSKRWGIETSYRMCSVFRAKTKAKHYQIRLFLFLFSVSLYNLWILFNAHLVSSVDQIIAEKTKMTSISFLFTLVLILIGPLAADSLVTLFNV
jgi:hypothetical protein